MRTIIELPDDQLEALEKLCSTDRISRAEAIRRAIAAHLRQHQAVDRKRAFGLWRARHPDGLKYQETRRREWDR